MSGRRPASATPSRAATLHVRDHCLCLHAQRAARALARRFDEALHPLGIRSGQFSLLMSLNRPETPALGAVAGLLGMDRTTLTANLKPLKRDGLVKLLRDEKDLRARRPVLTDKGRALLARAIPLWAGAHEEVERIIPGKQGGRLRADLNALAGFPTTGEKQCREPVPPRRSAKSLPSRAARS